MEPEISLMYAKIARATATMTPVVKDQTADAKTYTYNYADLSSVLRIVKGALASEGLILMQPIARDGDYMMITTLIVDTAGGNFLSFPGPSFKISGDPQAIGSAISYGRRYALLSLFALEQEDDDGAQATRAARDPHNRTPAETEIRAIISAMTPEDQTKFIADFKSEFGTSLTDMPESRHGEALGYAKFWIKPPEEPASVPSTTAEWAKDEANIDSQGG
jgi:hypothetical protein